MKHVVGGSIAGLLAACAVADHAEQVTIVDRDVPPRGPEPRKPVPQGRHVHVLLPAGADAIEEMLPSFKQELIAAGAPTIDAGLEISWFIGGRWRTLQHHDLTVFAQSRPFLEWELRKRIERIANVRCLYGAEVGAPVFDASRARVVGLTVARNGSQEELPADLVLDCAGRSSKLSDWLQQNGYAAPPQTDITGHIGYASRIMRPAVPPAWKMLIITATPPHEMRAGIVSPVEGGNYMVTLMGRLKMYPPQDEEGYLEYARLAERPQLYDFIRQATPLTPIVTYRYPTSTWRHYERLTRFPDGLLPLGDTIVSFNPVYGQGMTVAALEAQALFRLMRAAAGRVDGELRRRFFTAALAHIQTAWELAAGGDFAYPATEGRRPPGTAFKDWYIRKFFELSSYDTAAWKEWLLVNGMLKPLPALTHPRLALRVLRHALTGGRPYPLECPSPLAEERRAMAHGAAAK